MAVKTTNTRITITISKKQYKWLDELCKEKKMKMSKLISWLLYQKSNDVEHTRNLLEHPNEELEQIDNEEINDLLKQHNININPNDYDKYGHHKSSPFYKSE